MLVSFWSPKGGSGTSVVAAAFAFVLARHRAGVRLVDLGGDQAAICNARPAAGQRGIGDWLAAGPTAPASAIDTFAVELDGDLSVVPTGTVDPGLAGGPAGAALAVVLRDDPRVSVVDAGLAESPASSALVQLADLSVLVTRACVLTLRRAQQRGELVRITSGVLLVDEPHRSLHARDVAELVGRPLLAVVPCAPDVARAVDAGLLFARASGQMLRPLDELVERLGLDGQPRRVA